MNKYKEALNYLRNSVLVTDHKQKERVNQCTEVLHDLIDKCIDEKGNLKVFASICIDEDKMKKICHDAFEEFKEQFVDSYEDLIDKATPKKPIERHYENEGEAPYIKYTCPNGCNLQLNPVTEKNHSYEDRYCRKCGQAIDWSDKDD